MKIKRNDAVVEVSEDYKLQAGETLFTATDQFASLSAAMGDAIADLKKTSLSKEQFDIAVQKITDNFNAEIAKVITKPVEKLDFAPQTPINGQYNVNTQFPHGGFHKSEPLVKYCNELVEWNKFGIMPNKMREYATMVEGTSTLGGAAVIEDFDLAVRLQAGKYSRFGEFITPRTMRGDTMNLVRRTGSSVAYVVPENNSSTASNMTIAPITVQPKKLVTEVTLSRELLEDSETILEALYADLGDARGKKLDNDWIKGTGAASELCTGWLNITDYQSEAAGDGAGISTVNLTFEDFNNCVTKVNPMLRQNEKMAWWIHPDNMGIVRSIKDDNNRPVFSEYMVGGQNGMNLSVKGSIFGFPVVESYSVPGNAPGADTEFAALVDVSAVTHAFYKKGMTIELVFNGIDTNGYDLQRYYNTSVFLRERIAITCFAPLDVDGENHSICVLKTPA